MKMIVELRQALERVGRRFRQVRFWGVLALCWLILGLIGLAFVRPGTAVGQSILWLLAVTAAVAAIASYLVAQRSARDPRWIARQVEAKHPELSAVLLAAVEQEVPAHGQLGFLQAAVVHEALRHGRSHDWTTTVPNRRLNTAKAAHWTALAFLGIVFVLMFSQGLSRPAVQGASTVMATSSELTIEPGNTEIERGTSLLVVARFLGQVPSEANLIVENSGQPEAPRPMKRNLEDPMFAGYVATVNADLAYHVEFGNRRSDTFHVKVFDYPELKRADAHLVFPSFTGLEPKTIADVRHITAVEGTELTLLCRLNKAVPQARLVDAQNQELLLTPTDPANHVYSTRLTLSTPRRFRVQLVDAEARTNKLPSEIVINVTRNQPPTVTIAQPGRDARVSPLEELLVKADIRDDFGLVRYGVSIAPAGQAPREIVLHEKGEAARRAQPQHVIDFEALKAQPDQVVTYFFWAEDLGPDGQPRRTSGDMYFAEVRHFEEIFRQGESQSAGEQRERQQREQQGEGSPAQTADQLAEMQKQIINGTWKLIRRETEAKPTDRFAPDSTVLRQAQQSALERAGQLAEQLEDPASSENLEKATSFMTAAEKHLGEAADKNAVPSLQPALSAAQAAYQVLLKLRAREFEVRRNNRQPGQQAQRGNNSRSPSQNQLRQLDLNNERNRYETQNAARERQQQQAQRDRERRETQEVADRLRELARRQNDLNERMKELQSALEQARSEQQREELQRQLKRLQDQQQQVLRDTEELQDRMDRDENRERMAEARQQVEQTRENIRQASEALEQGRLSQAINEGTRAGRQLNDLRDELRRDTANRFGDEMRDMREQARKLDEDQKQLNQQLDENRRDPKRQLRDTGEREQVRQGLEQQRNRLDQLMDRMRRTVEEAEQPEPRLAQELYNTVRNATEQKVGDALNTAQRLTGTGAAEQASEASRRAGQGLEQVRQGIERAAESVLGGETDSLRRAQRELDELAEQLNREITQATGRNPAERPGQEGQPGQRGQQGEQQPRPGQQGQRGERGQQGQQGDRQQQPGQQGQQQPGQQDQRGQQGQQGQQGQRGQPGQQPQQGQRGGQRRSLTDRPNQNDPNRANPPDGQQPPQPGGQQREENNDRREGARGGPGSPIRGEGYREWNDRMRATEELLEDPQLRAEAALIRDRARVTREEFKRHSKEPDWNQLQNLVSKPLNELRKRVAEEIRRRESPNALVPIDRDPVPPEFTEPLRRYYERLGSDR